MGQTRPAIPDMPAPAETVSFGCALTRISQVLEWQRGAAIEFGDPSEPVCQLFFRWIERPHEFNGDELVCGITDGRLFLGLPDSILLPVVTGNPTWRDYVPAVDGGRIESFGLQRIAPGVWSLMPSLNMHGLLHAFVVLFGVPDSEPWDRRIVLVESLPADFSRILAAREKGAQSD